MKRSTKNNKYSGNLNKPPFICIIVLGAFNRGTSVTHVPFKDTKIMGCAIPAYSFLVLSTVVRVNPRASQGR